MKFSTSEGSNSLFILVQILLYYIKTDLHVKKKKKIRKVICNSLIYSTSEYMARNT